MFAPAVAGLKPLQKLGRVRPQLPTLQWTFQLFRVTLDADSQREGPTLGVSKTKRRGYVFEDGAAPGAGQRFGRLQSF